MKSLFTPSQVMSSSFDDEEVLLDLKKGVYYSLNAVGKEIWQLINKGRNFDTIVDTIQGRYRVDQSMVSKDVRRLLDDLIDQGLVEEK